MLPGTVDIFLFVRVSATAHLNSVASFGIGYTVNATAAVCGLLVVTSRQLVLLFGLATASFSH